MTELSLENCLVVFTVHKLNLTRLNIIKLLLKVANTHLLIRIQCYNSSRFIREGNYITIKEQFVFKLNPSYSLLVHILSF